MFEVPEKLGACTWPELLELQDKVDETRLRIRVEMAARSVPGGPAKPVETPSAGWQATANKVLDARVKVAFVLVALFSAPALFRSCNGAINSIDSVKARQARTAEQPQ